jgi:hypothetical protein
LYVLARASGRENRLVHISSDSVIAVKENTAVSFYRPKYVSCIGNSTVRSLYINALFHHLHDITPINVNSLLCSIRQEESSPK